MQFREVIMDIKGQERKENVEPWTNFFNFNAHAHF